MNTSDAVIAVGALADSTRRKLYEYVVSQRKPVTREQAAEAISLSLSKAKFHLDRLADEGLLDVEFRRISGRTGPGAGRPSKLYSRSSQDVQVSLPERRYDIMGSILAEAVTRVQQGQDLATTVPDSAYARGVADAQAISSVQNSSSDERVTGGEFSAMSQAADVLSRLGYEPEIRDELLVMHNCPFDALVDDHRDLVCGTNQHYVQGVLDACQAQNLESSLARESGMCCVVARQRAVNNADPA